MPNSKVLIIVAEQSTCMGRKLSSSQTTLLVNNGMERARDCGKISVFPSVLCTIANLSFYKRTINIVDMETSVLSLENRPIKILHLLDFRKTHPNVGTTSKFFRVEIPPPPPTHSPKSGVF